MNGRSHVTAIQETLNVLLVEDEDQVRADTAELLRETGNAVVESRSAEEAMALLHTTRFDILVADIGLPGVQGDVFAAEARLIQPNLGIVFATGNDCITDPGRDDPGPVVLRKPYDIASLAAALEAARPRSRVR